VSVSTHPVGVDVRVEGPRVDDERYRTTSARRVSSIRTENLLTGQRNGLRIKPRLPLQHHRTEPIPDVARASIGTATLSVRVSRCAVRDPSSHTVIQTYA
jgi:hypothetical protein